MKLTDKLKLTDDRGFASLIIALILIIVLGLLTVGFAELMRHSQTQELNRHLSDQAYYAAESGVNDAARALHKGLDDSKTDCGAVKSGSPLYDNTIAKDYLSHNSVGDSGASWTCLLINPHPDSLVYDSVKTEAPTTFIFQPVNSDGDPLSLNRLDIYWQGSDKSDTSFRPTYSSALPTSGSWNSIGGLRFAITSLNDMTRKGLIDNTYTAFLYPCAHTACSHGVGHFSYGAGLSSSTGASLSGGCDEAATPRYCHATINDINGAAGQNYLVRMRSIYDSTSVYIEGCDTNASPCPSGHKVSFKGAQSLVDSTGKAQNVLRRIQVRIPSKPDYIYPGFAAQASGSICKKLSAYPPNYFSNDCSTP